MASLIKKQTSNLHKQMITSIHIPDGGASNELMTSSRDGSVLRWTSSEQGLIVSGSCDRMGGFVNSAILDKTQTKIVAAVEQNYACIIDTETKKKTILRGHTGPVRCVDINQDNSQILTGSIDGRVILWNVLGEQVYSLPPQNSWVTVAKFLPGKNDEIIVGYANGRVRIYDITNNNLITTYFKGQKEEVESEEVGSPISSLSISAGGPFCSYATLDGTFYILNLDVKLLVLEQNCNSCVTSLCFALTKPFLAVSTKRGVIIYDVLTSKRVVEEEFPKGNSAESICFLNDSLVCGFKNGEVSIFDLVD